MSIKSRVKHALLAVLHCNKKRATLVLFISWPTIDRFSKNFSLAHSVDNFQ